MSTKRGCGDREKTLYSRKEIDEARRELADNPDWRRPVYPVVDTDAPYVGKGPLYVWCGDHWLDWNKWLATLAVIERDDRPTPPPQATTKEKKKKKARKTDDEYPTLFGDDPGSPA